MTSRPFLKLSIAVDTLSDGFIYPNQSLILKRSRKRHLLRAADFAQLRKRHVEIVDIDFIDGHIAIRGEDPVCAARRL